MNLKNTWELKRRAQLAGSQWWKMFHRFTMKTTYHIVHTQEKIYHLYLPLDFSNYLHHYFYRWSYHEFTIAWRPSPPPSRRPRLNMQVLRPRLLGPKRRVFDVFCIPWIYTNHPGCSHGKWRLIYVYMGVSKNRCTMVYPQIIHFNRVFHYKPSILGYQYFWKHPYSSGFPNLKT